MKLDNDRPSVSGRKEYSHNELLVPLLVLIFISAVTCGAVAICGCKGRSREVIVETIQVSQTTRYSQGYTMDSKE